MMTTGESGILFKMIPGIMPADFCPDESLSDGAVGSPVDHAIGKSH
jgi:hypothetical protein